MKRKKCTYLGKYDPLCTEELAIHKNMYLSQNDDGMTSLKF